jgi:hypothetical protein
VVFEPIVFEDGRWDEYDEKVWAISFADILPIMSTY